METCAATSAIGAQNVMHGRWKCGVDQNCAQRFGRIFDNGLENFKRRVVSYSVLQL